MSIHQLCQAASLSTGFVSVDVVASVTVLAIIVALICAFVFEMRRALTTLMESEEDGERLRDLVDELRAERAADLDCPLDVDTVDL